MDSLLRKIESNEVVVYTDQVYSAEVLNKCREIHKKLVVEGKMEKEFASDKWIGYSGVKKFGIDFSIDIKSKDEKSGKIIERPKLCTLKIEEINNSRSLTASINTNLLLRASNIDTFIEQPDLVKRKMIVETRETVDKLLIRNGNLTRENEALKSENKSIKSEILKMTDKVAVLKKTQDKLIKQVTYLMKTTDEAKRKEILSQMGIEDGFVDLNIYSENLQQELLESNPAPLSISILLRRTF